jgi:hypothetical protein
MGGNYGSTPLNGDFGDSRIVARLDDERQVRAEITFK